VVELAGDPDDILARLHSGHRRDVRRARRDGLMASVRRRPPPERAAAFAALYRETMERVRCAPFYRFPERLLTRLLALDEMSLAAVDDAEGPVAMALFLASGRELFYYLSASTKRAASQTANALLHDEARRFACRNGFERLHYGGGGEGLRGFKSRLADGEEAYYVLRRVHDERAYARLLAANDCREGGEFPAYRELLFKASPERC
jgi:predicted N-acyltransferase